MGTISADEIDEIGDDLWAVVNLQCDLSSEADELVTQVAQNVRDVYGESEILGLIPDDSVAGSFNTKSLLKAFRSGLPDPNAEGKKPEHLKNYRSETAEVVARETLNNVFNVDFTPALHATKGNGNQPLLGFDGWGIRNNEGESPALALYQVKGTEDNDRPPLDVSSALADECSRVPYERDILSRHISACVIRVKDTPYVIPLLHMLSELGENKLPKIIVCPVIVRGKARSELADLSLLIGEAENFSPASACGLTVSIGQHLNAFGHAVMTKARSHE